MMPGKALIDNFKSIKNVIGVTQAAKCHFGNGSVVSIPCALYCTWLIVFLGYAEHAAKRADKKASHGTLLLIPRWGIRALATIMHAQSGSSRASQSGNAHASSGVLQLTPQLLQALGQSPEDDKEQPSSRFCLI